MKKEKELSIQLYYISCNYFKQRMYIHAHNLLCIYFNVLVCLSIHLFDCNFTNNVNNSCKKSCKFIFFLYVYKLNNEIKKE